MAKPTNAEIQYVSNQIRLKVGNRILPLITKESKEIKGSDLIETLDYKKGKKYNLKELEINDTCSEEEVKYMEECHTLIKNIIDKL